MDSQVSQNLLSHAFSTAAEPPGQRNLVVGLSVDYPGVSMTDPIDRPMHVFAYRADSGIHSKDLADPELRKLRIGVHETSGLRQTPAGNGLKYGIHVLTVSYDTAGDPDSQHWQQVPAMARGQLDVVGAWGPFARYVKAKQPAPIVLQPGDPMADDAPLEFTLGVGVRDKDAVLKYALDNATGSGGSTALMIAAGCENGQLAPLPAPAGAKIDARVDRGKSALDIDEENGDHTAENTLELLARSAAHPGAADAGSRVQQ